MSEVKQPVVLVDDGEYYIEHNINHPLEQGNGFLLRRCAVTLMTPGGYECIGSYECKPGRLWSASIDAEYNEQTDLESRSLGTYENRLDAIAALWQHRHDALCRHK